ncbi:MAG: hypothetical protein JO352_19445 [Chloroflexi bacterium]|nr:hypothetical protein [Chloroflexota bacterium]MBV9601138.1 hypothetical protein [Chloroflexota bacterium]
MSSAEAEAAVRAVERVLELRQMDDLPPQAIQRLVSLAVKLYIAKRETGCEFDPVAEGDLTATEVSETASGLLRAVRLEPFELGWWRRLGQL